MAGRPERCLVTARALITDSEGGKMEFTVEIEQETDGRWIAEVIDIPGVMVYGDTPELAVARAKALALRVLADRMESGEEPGSLDRIVFANSGV